MPPSRLDGLYRRLLMTKFFTKGWGAPDNLQRLFEFRKILANRELCYKMIPKDYPIEITKDEKTSDCRIIEGKFTTPLERFLPGLVPKIVQDAHFQILLPLKWNDEDFKPVCLHLAGTGDHYFWRRRNLIAKPLMKEGNMGAILLENPYYGLRKPEDQIRSCLHSVSDIFVMGGCLVLESIVLLNWCEKNGLGPLGITGLSMGGHMASLAATNWPKPLVLVPCLSWSTASSVFTQGVMSQSINWDFLETQYYADGNFRERLAKMVTIVDDSYLAGQNFVQNFNQSMTELKSDINVFTDITIDRFKEMDNNTKTMTINGKKTLSPELLDKLMSKDVHELSSVEINKLNENIKEIQVKIETNEISNEIVQKLEITSFVANVTNGITNGITNVGTKLMDYILPSTPDSDIPAHERIDITKTKWYEREALQFMRGVMDECTHLKNFTVPYDTSLITVVCAKDDAYIPRDGCTSLEELWPGAEIKYLDAGHVSAYVLHQKLFRSSILEAFERAKKKWEPVNQKTVAVVAIDNNLDNSEKQKEN